MHRRRSPGSRGSGSSPSSRTCPPAHPWPACRPPAPRRRGRCSAPWTGRRAGRASRQSTRSWPPAPVGCAAAGPAAGRASLAQHGPPSLRPSPLLSRPPAHPAHQRLVGRVHDVTGAVAHHAERLARAKAFARDGCARPPVDQARRRDRGRRRLDHADQRSALGKERRPAARPTHEGRAGALPKPGVAHAAILDAVGRARLGRRL